MCCEDPTAKKAGFVSGCVVFITAIVLIAISISAVEPNEVGLEFKGPTQSLNTDKLYENGIHFLGVGHRFFKYPSALQSVRFTGPSAIAARTKDGLRLSLELSFNYKLTISVSDIVDLYLSFGEMEDVSQVYNRIARNWVRVVSSRHDAFAFFLNRTLIQAEMQTALDEQLRLVHASVDSFQLLSLSLPSRFEDARIRQETAVQEIQQAENDRDVAEINAQTAVNRAEKEAEVLILNARASATAIQLQSEATLQSIREKYTAERDSYALLATERNLTSSELLAYVWLDAFENRKVAGGVVHLPVPADLATPPY